MITAIDPGTRESAFAGLTFRCQLVLMALGEYAYGDHVQDPAAFVRRCRTVNALRRAA